MTTAIVIFLRVLAVALLAAAVYFYRADETDRVFASVVLAACSYFFSLRFSFKRKIEERAADETESAAEPD